MHIVHVLKSLVRRGRYRLSILLTDIGARIAEEKKGVHGRSGEASHHIDKRELLVQGKAEFA